MTPKGMLALMLAGVLAAVSACGNSKPDITTGKQLFTQKCGACHILNNAGTKGIQGPNLDLAFKFKGATAKAGKVTVQSKNDASVSHDIALTGGPAGKIVSSGATSTFTANLKPGSYTFYCTVPGHEQAGMKGTLTIK